MKFMCAVCVLDEWYYTHSFAKCEFAVKPSAKKNNERNEQIYTSQVKHKSLMWHAVHLQTLNALCKVLPQSTIWCMCTYMYMYIYISFGHCVTHVLACYRATTERAINNSTTHTHTASAHPNNVPSGFCLNPFALFDCACPYIFHHTSKSIYMYKSAVFHGLTCTPRGQTHSRTTSSALMLRAPSSIPLHTPSLTEELRTSSASQLTSDDLYCAPMCVCVSVCV